MPSGPASGEGLLELLEDDAPVAVEREDRGRAATSIGTNPPPCSIRRITSVEPVGGRRPRRRRRRLPAGRRAAASAAGLGGRRRRGRRAGDEDEADEEGRRGQGELRHVARDAATRRSVPAGPDGAPRQRQSGSNGPGIEWACRSRARSGPNCESPMRHRRRRKYSPRHESRFRDRGSPLALCPPVGASDVHPPVTGVEADRHGDAATGGSGEGVPGPNADLPRLLGGVHLLRRRAGIFREQGLARTTPSGAHRAGRSRSGREPSVDRGSSTRRSAATAVARRWSRSRRATTARLLQHVLRQGSGGDAGGTSAGV